MEDRSKHLWDLWTRYRYVMFPQQRKIYQQIADRADLEEATILEAGCGNGTGSYMLAHVSPHFTATDISKENIAFAKELYPAIDFDVWDIERAWYGPKYDWVVAVEVIEHVKDVKEAIANMLCVAELELWISTPNAAVREPVTNPHHVKEYTTREMASLLYHRDNAGNESDVEMYDWNTMQVVDPDTDVDPVLYRVVK